MIRTYVFSGCTSLTSITVSGNNTVYQSIDGNLYTKDGTKFMRYASGKTSSSFAIPNSVTMIDFAAFAGTGENGGDVCGVIHRHPEIDFGIELLEFRQVVVVEQTSGDDDFPVVFLLFPLHGVGDLPGSFAAGGGEKGAGVDDVNVCLFGGETEGISGGKHGAGDDFCFHQIFGTAQSGDEKSPVTGRREFFSTHIFRFLQSLI
jgi:hypothetical protein